MNIKDLCIGDSQIQEYQFEQNTLTMIIRDYSGCVYKIVMSNCAFLAVKGSVGFNLDRASFANSGAGHHWHFYDEDGSVLEVRFSGYVMKSVG